MVSRRPTSHMRSRRRATPIALLLVVLMMTACSGGTTRSAPDPASATPPALGQAADASPSCSQTTSPNPQALVPGSARPAAGATGQAGQVGDDSLGSYATFLATGVAAYTSGPSSLVGWAMGQLLGTQGGSVPPALTAQLDQLSGQISQISSQLTAIEGQLAAITNLIQDSTYLGAIKSLTTDHIAPILSMWQQYCDIVSTGDTNSDTLKQLATDVLDSNTGIRPHVTAIAETFQGSQLTGDVPLPGMFSQFVFNQKQAGTFDDTVVYKNYLTPYTQYFAGLGVIGMTLMVEAFHQNGDIKGAEAALADLWTDVRTIYQAGGFPITNANVITHQPTGTVWTRSGMCFVAQFASSAAQTWMSSTDLAQQALAFNAMYAQSNSSNLGAIASQQGRAPMTVSGGATPTALPNLTQSTPAYTFDVGDSVCSTLWFIYGAEPTQFMPTMIKESNVLPSASLYDGTGDPNSVWRDPADTDFQALTAGRGGSSSQAYLNANGFTIPSSGIGGVNLLAYNYWQGFQSGIFDPSADTYTCEFFAKCDGGGWVSLFLIATPQCWLGSADYKGLASTCGTAWLDAIWAANPPPPSGGTTTSSAGG